MCRKEMSTSPRRSHRSSCSGTRRPGSRLVPLPARDERLFDRIGVIACPPVPHEVTLRINLLHGAVEDRGVGTVGMQAGEIHPRKGRVR